MFNTHRQSQFEAYNRARRFFVSNPMLLINLEKLLADSLYHMIHDNIDDITADYNEASYLYPFWENYPPDSRGRQPIGDQYPWIEVGEHAIGCKLPRLLGTHYEIRDVGLPTGTDQRFAIKHNDISVVTESFTDSCWLFIDIKSVGPRDDQEHTVMSHNQISGNGEWSELNGGGKNKVMKAVGLKASHDFHCSLPPIYILNDGTILPVVLLVLKPVYRMLSLIPGSTDNGQPLERIAIIAVPNGILLEENPNYLERYPKLLFPGKDDKSKNPLKVRCRISFTLLQEIAVWRVREITLPIRE